MARLRFDRRSILQQSLGVSAGVGGDLREPRFLLGRKVNLDGFRRIRKRALGQPP